jgi:hypothetical protein
MKVFWATKSPQDFSLFQMDIDSMCNLKLNISEIRVISFTRNLNINYVYFTVYIYIYIYLDTIRLQLLTVF